MLIVFFILTATVSGQRQDAHFVTHLYGAMVGFEPFCMNGFRQPNPGAKSMILQPLRTPLTPVTDEVKPNHFINEAEELKCVPELEVQTVTNFVDYLDLAASSTFRFSSDANLGTTSLRYDNYALCETKNNHRDQELLQFFQNTGGEIVFASAECVTHSITVTPSEPVVFTSAFETALVRLYKAAVNPGLKEADRTFSDFISFYGTHFAVRTQLGAKVYLGKRFTNRSATASDEATRRRCVLDVAHKVLTPNTRMRHETTHMHFDRASVKNCGGSEHEVMVAISGPLPEASLQDWASAAEKLPDPIFYHLEPISTLFKREWMSSHAGTSRINKTLLHQYFMEKLSNRTNSALNGGFQQQALKGCGLNSRCEPGSVCLNEADSRSGFRCVSKHEADLTTSPAAPTTAAPTTAAPTTAARTTAAPTTAAPTTASSNTTSTTTAAPFLTEGLLIIGGVGVTVFSETLGAPESSIFPGLVYGNVAVHTGTTVYSCGGHGKSEKACYFLRAQNQSWSSIALPWQIVSPKAVAVQNQIIWFLQDSNLYTFDTAKDKGQFREYRLSFPFSTYFCVVTNRTHTFAIGVGLGFDEVWVNKDPSRPTKWEKVSNLMESRRGHSCLWLGSDIFVTGGRDGDYNGIDSVVVINVADMTSRTSSPMVYSREDHQMAVLEGKPAVLGGYSTRVPTNTIEVYDATVNEWQTLDYNMKQKRASFGVAQYTL